MNMKDHILSAMREQFDRWEELLARLSEVQIIAPRFDLDWSIKDVMAHLWGWQQISIARVEGGLHDRETQFPAWVNELGNVWEEDANRTNDRIHELNHLKTWSEMYESWRNGYLRLLEAGSGISERDLLDGDRYPWLGGYSLAFILVASYEHHQEHYEKLTAGLKEL
jgi:hypothetical protein